MTVEDTRRWVEITCREADTRRETGEVTILSAENAESGLVRSVTVWGRAGNPVLRDVTNPTQCRHYAPEPPPPPALGEPVASQAGMRRFVLARDRDVSGVSGTGIVCFGVLFPDGRVATRWNGVIAQTCCWDSIDDVTAVHGHGGATRIEWVDGP